MTDITNVVSAVITLLVAVITTFLIPYLKEKVDAEKFEKIKGVDESCGQAAGNDLQRRGSQRGRKSLCTGILEQQRGYKARLRHH